MARKPKPWGTIIATIAVLALAAGVFTYAAVQINEKNKWVVSEDNRDPSDNIPGVQKVEYKGSQHVKAEQRVAYDQSPPFGGPHDGVWADCTGIVYPTAVRNENMVHSLEHGTVWIAYDPGRIQGGALDKLKSKVEGQQYMMLSPYPGLDRPVSLQSWGHQLKVDSADDARIDDFIRSLRGNQYQTPEPGGRCDAADPTVFDVTKPPPFVSEKPGPDAVKMDGTGAITETNEGQMQTSGAPLPTSAPAAPPAATSQPAPSQ
ncbi:DUF3105 domain-containing protein [Actinophytocola sp.]|uniref:DUF3105 domain-containing protein n=1 Tax=Actinophytocola sp. TaxID=1872138 RepID=UPI002D7F6D10|nr:DUF3105 domain-containing protein [Actinophytocola sp.]HET9139029.1 DUF3105 domain-containing protein [Actinophytocola sp.]